MKTLSTTILLALALCAACAPDFEPSPLEDGVERSERNFRVRVDEVVSTFISAPASGEPAPLALVIHGGAVPPERYLWLSDGLAARGYLAITPRHAFNLSIFQGANDTDIVDAVLEASERAGDPLEGRVDRDAPGLAIGHSLGGVMAASAWRRAPDRFVHLVTLSGIPNPDEDFSERSGPVLSITGSVDERITPEEVEAGFEAVGLQAAFAVVVGMNHYQFTDDPTESELANDGEATVSEAEARDEVFTRLEGFLR